MNKKIGVVVADKDEFSPLMQQFSEFSPCEEKIFSKKGLAFAINNCDIICINCGIGKVNAAAAAMHLVDKGCDYIVNFGLSGGISNVKRGQVVVPQRFLEHDFDLTNIGFKLCEKPGQEYIYSADSELCEIFSGALGVSAGGTAVCGDRFICSDTDRTILKQNFDATSCDMETAAIASVCYDAHVPFCSLRRISDDAGDTAIDTYRDMNENDSSTLASLFKKCLLALVEHLEDKN